MKSTLDQVDRGTAGTPLAPLTPNSSPGNVADLKVNLTPLATACAQATGSGTALANTTVTVGGQDVTEPVVQALPGLLAPCPAGASGSSVTGPGGTGSVDGGFVGLCLRADQAPPLKASVIAADSEIISSLTKAGVPLQDLVVPCPKGAPGTGGGSTGGSTGGSPGGTGGGTAGGSTGAGQTPGAGGGAAGDGASDSTVRSGSTGNGLSGNGEPCTINSSPTAMHSAIGGAGNALPWVLLLLVALGRKRIGRMVSAVRVTRD